MIRSQRSLHCYQEWIIPLKHLIYSVRDNIVNRGRKLFVTLSTNETNKSFVFVRLHNRDTVTKHPSCFLTKTRDLGFVTFSKFLFKQRAKMRKQTTQNIEIEDLISLYV